MTRYCYATTSWDDGHPSDLRIADMLARRDIPGTFYVPAASQRECLGTREIRILGQSFEIGAHTLRHLRLDRMTAADAGREIAGSKEYIEQTVGRSCRLFAPPNGRFTSLHLRMAEQAGFRGFRTTELMSLAPPRPYGALAVMPTTLQVYRHSPLAYGKNALRRLRPLNFWLYFHRVRGLDPRAAFESLLTRAIARGGVVHLWGHGWEIEEHRDWSLLTEILDRLVAHRSEVRLVSNSTLCEGAFAHECLTRSA